MTAQETGTVGKDRRRAAALAVSIWPTVFIVALSLPFILQLGSIRLTPYRLLLLAAVFPCLAIFASGKAGRMRSYDLLIMFFGAWCAISMVAVMGFDQSMESLGIWLIETYGAYFLARTCIRNAEAYGLMCRTLVVMVAILLPFAILESVTGKPILLTIAAKILPTIDSTEMDTRMGLRRAQVAFEHPILFGLYCSYPVAFALYGGSKKQSGTMSRSFRTAIPLAGVFLSLSTGAYLSVAAQFGLAIWERLTRRVSRRWLIFFGLVVAAYVTVDALSNRSPFQVFVSYLTFSSSSSYNRILIWDYGTAQVLKTPWVGIGLSDDWERPVWMKASVDNFWLLIAIRHGLPAIASIGLATVLILYRAGRATIADERVRRYRDAYVMAVIGVGLAACTVHLWNASYVLFIFFLGAGAWFVDEAAPPDAPASAEQREARQSRQAPPRRTQSASRAPRPGPVRPA